MCHEQLAFGQWVWRWIDEQFDKTVIIGGRNERMLWMYMSGIHVGQIGARRPDAHTRRTEHGRVCVPVDARLGQIGVNWLTHARRHLIIEDLVSAAVQHKLITCELIFL
jgi:hypothetical protein